MLTAQEPALLDQLIARIASLPEAERKQFETAVLDSTKGMKFIPNPGPQTAAWHSKADILLYGGEAGGGKTGLLIGLALQAHQRSLILRRKYTDLSGIIEEAIKLNGTRDGYNGKPPPSLRTSDKRLIEFGAVQLPDDWQNWMGRAHDLLGIDEAAQFMRDQVRALMAWVRTTEPGQRCRIVLATNPPVSAEGEWLIEMFRPWLDPTHHNQAKQGELRWYVTDDSGQDLEVDGPEPVEIDGKTLRPMSRTFIRSTVDDNPFLKDTDYKARLDSLPEPVRSSVRDGNFMAARKDDEWQAIPTAWIRAAQARWTPKPPEGVPMCAIAADVTGGGEDENVFAPRFDGWYAPLTIIPGKDTPHGDGIGGHILRLRTDQAEVVIDMGGGFGNLPYKELRNNGIEAIAYKGAESSTRRSNDGLYGYANKRSESVWRFREALDPSQPGGSIIALPDDPILVADLTSLRYDIVPLKGRSCVRIEAKDKVKERLGRSPGRGDAVLMAWVTGQTGANQLGGWRERSARGSLPKVNLGYSNRKGR